MNYLENPGNRINRDLLGLVHENNRDTGLFRSTLNLFDQNVGYTSALSYPEELHPFVYAASIADNVSSVLLKAEISRQFAISYRDFLVGAAAMAVFRRGDQLRKAYVHGANVKPNRSDDVNVHAEHTIFSMVDADRLPGETTQHIPLIAVIGDLQADQQSGTSTKTLHPCGVCRDMFTEEGSPIDDLSLIVTATADFRVMEYFTRRALLTFHETGDSSGIGRVEFDERHPMLTLPDYYIEAMKTGVPVNLAEHDTELAMERDYEARVRDPIFHYVAGRAMAGPGKV